MFFALALVSALVLGGAMWHAYRTTRDPLHPLMYLAPLCFYSYVYKPIALYYMGILDAYFDGTDLVYVQIVNLCGLVAFCIGTLWHCHDASLLKSPGQSMDKLQAILTPVVRQRAIDVAYVLGGSSLIVFWSTIYYVGGLGVVYGQAKGGINPASGYLGEAPFFSLPAIGLLYFAWAGQRITPGKIILLLIFASPMIVHGLLGARRGPTFMVGVALLIGGYVVSSRRPKLITVLVTIFLLGTLLLFLLNNRGRIFLGSDAMAQWTDSSDVSQQEVDAGEDWVHSGGTILTSRDTGTHFWGTRILVNTFVRPIPRQIWPDKYISTGFGWLDDQADMLGMTDNEWMAAVGWIPVRGAAAGFVADLYLEFGWLGLLACWLLGWVYSWLWRGMVTKRGLWAILYLNAAIVSIYVPTQNVTDAWLYRMILFSAPTMVLWRLLIHPVLATNNDRAVTVAENKSLPRSGAFRRRMILPAGGQEIP